MDRESNPWPVKEVDEADCARAEALGGVSCVIVLNICKNNRRGENRTKLQRIERLGLDL